MMKRLPAVLVILGIVAGGLPGQVLGQGTTGTIRGKITDAVTGDPLAAVNVVVLESDGTATTMGTMTNAEGVYVIVNVPPAIYRLRASMMGYNNVEVENLVVTVGRSTVRDFQLTTAVLDVTETITVTADRDLIQRDMTGTQQSYLIEEMQRMAVSSTTDILTMQTNVYQMEDMGDMIPGYRDRGLEQIHMRGGRNAEVAFMIDGMQVTNLIFGGQAARVSPFSLSEMVIMAGGMSAEFGNAMSGVINLITREGGSRYAGNLEWLTSEHKVITGAADGADDARDYTSVQGYVGGPVPGVGALTFNLSGSATTGRDYLVLKDNIVLDYRIDPTDPNAYRAGIDYYGVEDPAAFDPDNDNPYLQIGPDGRRISAMDIYSGWLGMGFDNRWDGMLGLTYRLSPTMKMNITGQSNGRWSTPYDFLWRFSMLWGAPENVHDYLTMGYPAWDAPEGAADPATGYLQNSQHLISGSGIVHGENEKNLLFENNYRLAGVWTHQLSPSTFYSVRASYYGYNRTMRVKRFVNQAGYYSNRTLWTETNPLWTPSDAMTEVTLLPIPYAAADPHGRRYGYTAISTIGGIGYHQSDRYFTNHHDITRTLKADLTSQVSMNHQVKTGFLYNTLTLDQYDVQLLYLSPPYIVDYRRSPWEFGAYIQDKIEYDFLIVDLGLRYDAANAGKVPFWADPRNPIHPDTGDLVIAPSDPEQAPVESGVVRSQFSPRLGIAHPVTDRAVFYFNYGQFFQNPIYRNLYIQGTLEDAIPLIGNPNLKNEKTVSYEFGFRQQFTDLIALSVALWTRDTSNLVGSELVPAFFGGASNPFSYTVFVNYDYAMARGLDLSLIRRYSNYWRGQVNYSYMTTQSNRDDPWQGYREDHDLETSPKRPRVLGWDQPHRVSADVGISTPDGTGPQVLGVRPFERLNASLIYRAAAGRPYTPATRERALELNSGRRPWTFQWDARFYRDFDLLGYTMSVFADIRNLFDRRNVIAVYARTGKADDPGPDATSFSDYYDRFHYYGTPRTINVGVRVAF
jgi:outer membrane receptor protein involved in Fe transport